MFWDAFMQTQPARLKGVLPTPYEVEDLSEDSGLTDRGEN